MTIDLRSDTVTCPTEPMRRAMAEAVVGDDVYREDPTVRALEERAAELLGKEAALFVPSGTMANQMALQLLCRAGDEVLVGEGAHVFFYECGAGSAYAGVTFVTVGRGGLFDASEMEAAIKPDVYYLAPSRLVCIENTMNRAGGLVFPHGEVTAIAERAHARGLAVHVDGARIWNAAIATGRSERELLRDADTVSACFSKGLGAPVGSVLAGPRDAMDRALRIRRRMGGAMRQSGILAAGALYALEHHRDRIADDHANARRLAEGIASIDGLDCDVALAETNIVVFDTAPGGADSLVARAEAAGVLLGAIGPGRVRAVTHLDVTREDVDRALETLDVVARS